MMNRVEAAMVSPFSASFIMSDKTYIFHLGDPKKIFTQVIDPTTRSSKKILFWSMDADMKKLSDDGWQPITAENFPKALTDVMGEVPEFNETKYIQ